MVKRWGAASIAALAGCMATGAAAQTNGNTTTSGPPNYGDYQSLDGLFRVGVQVTNPTTGQSQSARYEQSKIDGIIDYFDPTNLAARFGTSYSQISAVSSVVDLRGVPAYASFAQNSRALVIRVPDLDEGTNLYQLTYNGTTRQQSFDLFDNDVSDLNSAQIQDLLRRLSKLWARKTPTDPLAGNPNSLQSQLVRGALDLGSGDSAVEQDRGGGANTAGDPWIIGASYNGGKAGRFTVSRFDARVARSFRVLAGNRSLLKIDLPVYYTRVSGAKGYGAQLGMGLEVPVIARRWSLEPRVAYGITYSDGLGQVGHIAQGTLTSRYVIEGLGRGRIVIGNMIGYNQTLSTAFTSYNIDPGLKNWAFRNGFAYELPLKMRAGGRLASVRASYSLTNYAGDELYNNYFHEFTFSFGVRGREESIRASRDLIRLNLTTIQARGFHSYGGGVGFRF